MRQASTLRLVQLALELLKKGLDALNTGEKQTQVAAGPFPGNHGCKDVDDSLKLVEAVLGKSGQHLLVRVQIVQQHVKGVERLEQVVEGNEFCIFEFWVD